MKLQGRETPEGRGFGKESFHRTDDTEDSSGCSLKTDGMTETCRAEIQIPEHCEGKDHCKHLPGDIETHFVLLPLTNLHAISLSAMFYLQVGP